MIDLSIPAQLSNFIGGEFLPPVNRLYIGTENPATGEAYLQLPQSDGEDVALAVQAAQLAFPEWSNLPAEKKMQDHAQVGRFNRRALRCIGAGRNE